MPITKTRRHPALLFVICFSTYESDLSLSKHFCPSKFGIRPYQNHPPSFSTQECLWRINKEQKKKKKMDHENNSSFFPAEAGRPNVNLGYIPDGRSVK